MLGLKAGANTTCLFIFLFNKGPHYPRLVSNSAKKTLNSWCPCFVLLSAGDYIHYSRLTGATIEHRILHTTQHSPEEWTRSQPTVFHLSPPPSSSLQVNYFLNKRPQLGLSIRLYFLEETRLVHFLSSVHLVHFLSSVHICKILWTHKWLMQSFRLTLLSTHRLILLGRQGLHRDKTQTEKEEQNEIISHLQLVNLNCS